jgi:hypothetical protein
MMLGAHDDDCVYDERKDHYRGIAWNNIFGIGYMCSNFANINLENEIASGICDPSRVVYIVVFPVVAVEEARCACGNNWGVRRNLRSDIYVDVSDILIWRTPLAIRLGQSELA